MKEMQPRRKKLTSAIASAGMVGIIAFSTACDKQDVPFLPLSPKESLSHTEEARLLESGFHLNGSGFILIPDTNNFPEDNFAVEVLLKSDPPSKVVSQITEDEKVLSEDVYTIFSQLGDFELTMHAREEKNDSISYSYVVRLTDKKNPVDASRNSCPVIAGYGSSKKVSAEDFTEPKKVTLKVKDGKPQVFEGGKRIRMHVGHQYITPEGDYTLKREETRGGFYDDPVHVFNTLIETPCDIGNRNFGIGGSMFSDGSLLGSFSGEIYQTKVSEIAGVGDLKKTIAEWDFRNGSLIDLSGNGYDGRIVGNVSIGQ